MLEGAGAAALEPDPDPEPDPDSVPAPEEESPPEPELGTALGATVAVGLVVTVASVVGSTGVTLTDTLEDRSVSFPLYPSSFN